MNITAIGRGNVGGGLARLWQRAGHTVKLIGRDGGHAADADAVLPAVASNAVSDALRGVSGLAGKVTIDATNAFAGRNDEFESLAHEARSVVGGPTAKAFNVNTAAIYDRIDEQRVPSQNLYASEDGARDVIVLPPLGGVS